MSREYIIKWRSIYSVVPIQSEKRFTKQEARALVAELNRAHPFFNHWIAPAPRPLPKRTAS